MAQDVPVDPKLPVVISGLLSALPQNKRLPGDRVVLHQAVQGLMHECSELAGIARFRGSGFSPEIDCYIRGCNDLTFAQGMMTVSSSSIQSRFQREASAMFEPNTVRIIERHAQALRGRIT